MLRASSRNSTSTPVTTYPPIHSNIHCKCRLRFSPLQKKQRFVGTKTEKHTHTHTHKIGKKRKNAFRWWDIDGHAFYRRRGTQNFAHFLVRNIEIVRSIQKTTHTHTHRLFGSATTHTHFYCATAAAAIARPEFAAKPLCCATSPFSTDMLSSQCLTCLSRLAHSFCPNVRNKVDFTFTLFAN